MRHNHIPYLRDPLSQEVFEGMVFTEADDHIEAGLLISPSNWYPIIAGIPRLVIGKVKDNLIQEHSQFLQTYADKFPAHVKQAWEASLPPRGQDGFYLHQTKTATSFAYEWEHIYRENAYEEQNFFHFLKPFVKAKDLQHKITLDIGCGSGRFTKWAALHGTTVSFGTDLGDSVTVAYELTKHLPNACIVQADIYAMPFSNIFDFAYSIGVLHHLPQPQAGFAKLPSLVKPNGQFLIWVYNRRHNARAIYIYEPLRSLARHIPKPILYTLCYLPALVVHLINQLTKLLLEWHATYLANKIPFSYYANFPFNMKLNDAFDVLATPKSNYYLVEEIQQWFRASHLKNIQAYEHSEAGITCIGTHG